MRAPPIVAPHQPRLDWQMWFAALGEYGHNPWLLHLAVHVLQNTPQVRAWLSSRTHILPCHNPLRS